jgi:hypothetical protein
LKQPVEYLWRSHLFDRVANDAEQLCHENSVPRSIELATVLFGDAISGAVRSEPPASILDG